MIALSVPDLAVIFRRMVAGVRLSLVTMRLGRVRPGAAADTKRTYPQHFRPQGSISRAARPVLRRWMRGRQGAVPGS